MRSACRRWLVFGAFLAVACAASFAAGTHAQSSSGGPTFESPGGTRLEVLFNGPTENAAVDVGLITFPPGTNSGDHVHGVTELFYVLEGELEHVVNGESHLLTEGMLGHVKPPDRVNHKVAADGSPARALVIWAPSGEADRITGNWTSVD